MLISLPVFLIAAILQGSICSLTGGACSEGPRYHPLSADMSAYATSTHAPVSATPPTHSTSNTPATGNSRNHSKASPIPLDTGAAVVLGLVVDGFVSKPRTAF